MKIVHIVNGNDVGGATTQVSALIKAQKELHTIEMIALDKGKIVEFCHAHKIPVKVVSVTPIDVYQLIMQIRSLSKEGAVIHLHGLKPMFFAGLASLFYKKSTIATIHSDYYFEYNGNKLKSFVALPMIKWSIKRINRFITVSERLIDVITSDGIQRDHCMYIANGLDLSLVKPKGSKEEFLAKYGIDASHVICGIAARIHPVKGIDVLIEVASGFKDEAVEFVIAGMGHPDYMEDLKKRVKEHGMEKQIHFIGFVDSVYDFYQAIDINLLTSYSEGFPYSVMEGGALAKPIVSTAVSGMTILIENNVNGFIVPIGDATAFQKDLRQLVDHAELRRRLGEALKEKVVHQYSNTVMALKYDTVYQQLLRGNNED
jgi:glycosyltransferase involved in cell wall biosynthesis